MAKRRRQLHELPVRTCRYGERCLVCLEPIAMGERYHDGGYDRRAHQRCAVAVQRGDRREPTGAELRELERAERHVSEAKGKWHKLRSLLHPLPLHGYDNEKRALRAASVSLLTARKALERLKEGWAQLEVDDDPR